MNNILRNIFVLKIANRSRPFETLQEKICVRAKIDNENIAKNSNVKYPEAVVIITNQKVNPAVTAIDLKRGDDSCNFKQDK